MANTKANRKLNAKLKTNMTNINPQRDWKQSDWNNY